MKFTIPLLIASFLITVNSLLFAQSININTAKKIAQNHLLTVGKNNLKSASPNQSKFQFSSVSVTSESKDTLYFVLNDTINHSFVIVAADKRSTPIIGYSLDGNYSENNQPPGFVAWMENRKKELESIKENNLQADSKISEQWDNLSSSNINSTKTTTSVEPLLKTKWNQDCFFNGLCPSDAGGSCGHVLTGCVATSIAQIMKYWNYPTTGTGSHSYLSAGYGILSADFGSTTYQWSQMPDVVTSQNDAVAMLMYHCGVALNMRYGPRSSGAFNPINELIKYFNYSPEAETVDKRSYSAKEWVNLLKSELDLGRPIWYLGAPNSCAESHAFVCDGFQNSDYFHFNWGWGGFFDGYYYLESLNPDENSYSGYQNAIIKISPGSLPDGYQGLILSTRTVGIGNNGGSVGINIKSSNDWTASADQAWLTINPNGGVKGSNAIIVNALANTTSGNRKATITVSGQGLVSQTIEVTQFSKFEVRSGNLKTILADQLSTITDLTLSGTIDARDFRTMRDEMPALTGIDLSRVTITTYVGTEGTIFQNYTYSANAIPNFAFQLPLTNLSKNRLKKIVLPPTLTSIEDYAFSYCKNLIIDSIPSAVNFIGDNVFSECRGSETFILPPTVAHIGRFAFQNFKGTINVDSNNTEYASIDGVLFNKTGTRLIQCPVTKTGNYSIPKTVTSIGYWAFGGCNSLTTISIPSTVTSIENHAFNECTGLNKITIPSSVTFIGQRAFGEFNGSITVDVNNPNFSAMDGVLFNKAQTEIIQCPVLKAGNYTIPPTVTTVKEEAFHSCKNIVSINIPPSVRSIGSFSFNCVGLSSIYVSRVNPVNLESSPAAFADVNKANCILYIPYGTKELYAAASQWKDFNNIVEMSGLFLSAKTIGIGLNGGTIQTNISSNVVWTATSDQQWLTINPVTGITGINTITFNAPVNPTASTRKATVTIAAEGLASQTIEVTQYGIVEATAGNLKTILSSQLSTRTSLTLTGIIDARDFKVIRDEMHELTDLDLSRVTIVTYTGTEGTADTSRVYYPENCVPHGAFDKSRDGKGDNVLKSIILPSSVTAIGNYAFSYCFGITTFSIPSSVTSIGLGAFYRCSGLKTINIPLSVSDIEVLAFYDFNGSITVDSNNPHFSAIDGVLFNKTQTELLQCPVSKTGSFTIPASVKTINEGAFSFCISLTNIIFPPTIISIGESAFSYCSGLTSINIPLSVVTIGRNAFASCEKLKTIRIPAAVNSIGSWAFAGCSGLNAIYAHPNYPVSLNNSTDVFSSVNNNICTLYVPFGSKAAYQTANQWKDFTNIVENKRPVAHAGTDQSIFEKNLVTLNGSASSDPDNDGLTYFWKPPTGITLNSNTVSKPTFTAPEVTTDTKYTFYLTVNDGWNNSNTDQVIVTVKNIDKAPYLKSPISNISVDKKAPDQIIDLKTVFADDDLADVLSYSVTANTNNQVVSIKITESNLTLSFSSLNTGLSEIVVTANSNGKEVISKFNVEVKIPTGINPIASNQDLIVYPNPANGKIKIVFDQIPQGGIELTVTGITGKTILKQIIQENEAWIDLKGNTPGVYLLKTNFNNTKAQKVILR